MCRDIVFKWLGIWLAMNKATDLIRYLRGLWAARHAKTDTLSGVEAASEPTEEEVKPSD